MTILETIATFPQSPKDVVEAVKAAVKPVEAAKFLEQYNIETHAVMKRPDKKFFKEDGITLDRVEPVAKIPIPLQKYIVQQAAAMLAANPIELDATPEGPLEDKMLAAVKKVWTDNKLDYKTLDLLEKMMSETEVAELWYNEELAAGDLYWQPVQVNASSKLRMRTVCFSLGDTLYPIWDETGNLIAFCRSFEIEQGEDKTNYFEVYTAANIYKASGKGDDLVVTVNVVNEMGKIPAIYYKQDKTEWSDVQPEIERLEMKISRHAGTNDRFDSPVIFTNGKINNMVSKDDEGRVFQGEKESKLEYKTWDNAPESTKMEIENLLKFIFMGTSTLDLSPENMKALFGSAPSGYAIKNMYTIPHLKAARKMAQFGESIQRRINYIKQALSVMDSSLAPALSLEIKPKFDFYLPRDVDGEVNTLSTALTAGIVSKETAVKLSPLNADGEAEWERVQAQQQTDDTNPAGLDNLMKVVA